MLIDHVLWIDTRALDIKNSLANKILFSLFRTPNVQNADLILFRVHLDSLDAASPHANKYDAHSISVRFSARKLQPIPKVARS